MLRRLNFCKCRSFARARPEVEGVLSAKGIVEKKMETTIRGYIIWGGGYRDTGDSNGNYYRGKMGHIRDESGHYYGVSYGVYKDWKRR